MKKKNAMPASNSKAKISKMSSAKVDATKPEEAPKIITFHGAVKPTLSDIIKVQSLELDNLPDPNEPIILDEAWYEYSVFKNKFNLSPNTANNWLDQGWLPHSKIIKMRFINKADIERMMLRFRRYTLLLLGYLMVFSNEFEGFFSM